MMTGRNKLLLPYLMLTGTFAIKKLSFSGSGIRGLEDHVLLTWEIVSNDDGCLTHFDVTSMECEGCRFDKTVHRRLIGVISHIDKSHPLDPEHLEFKLVEDCNEHNCEVEATFHNDMPITISLSSVSSSDIDMVALKDEYFSRGNEPVLHFKHPAGGFNFDLHMRVHNEKIHEVDLRRVYIANGRKTFGGWDAHFTQIGNLQNLPHTVQKNVFMNVAVNLVSAEAVDSQRLVFILKEPGQETLACFYDLDKAHLKKLSSEHPWKEHAHPPTQSHEEDPSGSDPEPRKKQEGSAVLGNPEIKGDIYSTPTEVTAESTTIRFNLQTKRGVTVYKLTDVTINGYIYAEDGEKEHFVNFGTEYTEQGSKIWSLGITLNKKSNGFLDILIRMYETGTVVRELHADVKYRTEQLAPETTRVPAIARPRPFLSGVAQGYPGEGTGGSKRSNIYHISYRGIDRASICGDKETELPFSFDTSKGVTVSFTICARLVNNTVRNYVTKATISSGFSAGVYHGDKRLHSVSDQQQRYNLFVSGGPRDAFNTLAAMAQTSVSDRINARVTIKVEFRIWNAFQEIAHAEGSVTSDSLMINSMVSATQSF